MVMSWAKNDVLKVTSSEKANGKFACCRVFDYDDCRYITFGSKNYHITIPVHLLHHWLGDDKIRLLIIIVYAIAKDIYINRDDIMKLMPTFNAGYTLCGELCDGQHFVPG